MRILEIETFGRGGLIHYAYNLSCALADRGHEVTLMTSAAYELRDHAAPTNVRLEPIIGRRAARRRAASASLLARGTVKTEALFDAFAVAARARRLGPDVIHFHSTNTSAIAFLAGLRVLRIPLVATAHVVTPHEPVRFQDVLYGRLHRLSHLTVAHSAFDKRRLIDEFDLDPDRVVVIPHGEYGFFERQADCADRDTARRRLGLGSEDEVVLFFGYIREYKGLDLLFDAWPAVMEARPKARLVVAGDAGRLGSGLRQELLALAGRLNAVHRFGYIPFSEVAGYFAAADAVAMPYRRVSQSGVLYLALSLGVPVVATEVGALPEVLTDGDSALLVPPESPDALAEALIRLLGDRELGDRLARGGRSLADRHSWPSIADSTEAAFSRIVQN
jgi:glycosyltransferase involved in cell wall biosynthesis